MSKSIMQKENIFQAVLVADNYNENFDPLTKDIPFALLPIINVPLIDYTLEFLSLGGINETFIFCTSHADVIKEHIDKSIKNSVGWSITMKINVIVSETCRSFGDALRDLDAKGLIRGDFVLLSAGTIANIKLLPILKKHNAITKKDKGAAMTIILQNAGSEQGIYSHDKVLVAADANNRVLYHKIVNSKASMRKINFPLEIFIDNSNISLHMDLKDTNVAICSSSVLPLFSDNFDFQTKDDFIRGLLMNEEILASTIYWHEIKGNQYGAAVTDWRLYQTLSHDIIHRWTYPLVPDNSFSSTDSSYFHTHNNIYKSKNVKLAKGTQLVEDVVIGNNTAIAEKCYLINTIVGNNCKIGKNVRIENSYIFSDTTIEDNCTVSSSCIGFRNVLGKDCKISNGCILGNDVHLKNNEKLENVFVMSHKPNEDVPVEKLGKKAFKFTSAVADDSSDSDEENICQHISRFHIDSDPDMYDSDGSIESLDSDNRLSHTTSPPPDDTNLFLNEVIDSLTRGFEDKLQCDNLILEINSSRYAYNVTVREVNYNVVKAILNMPFQSCSAGQSYLHILHSLLTYFLPILMNYIKNEDAMNDCLHALEEVAGNNSELIECVSKVLAWLYEKDIIEEDIITNWHQNLDESGRLHARVKPFVQWLEEADEESESD